MDNMELVRMLKGLEVEQIREVQRRLKEKYPEDKKLLLQCQTAIGMRREQEKRDYIKALIEEVKSAPNGEATPNGASNQITKH